MKFKKMVSVLLIAAFIGVMVTGCGSGAKTQSGASLQATNSAGTSVATGDTLNVADKAMTINLWDIATEEGVKPIQEGAISRFVKAHPNVKVVNTHIANDTYKQKLVVAMSSGQCPDMYIHMGGGPMDEYIDSGFAVPITDLMKKYCKVNFLKVSLTACSYKGQIYGVPYAGIDGSGFYYNKTIFSKLSLKVPKTISELEKVCDTLKKNGYTPFSLANQSKWTGSMYFAYLAARKGGVDEFNKATAGTGSFESEGFQYAGEMIQKWVKAGYFPDGVNSLNADDGQDNQLMYQGKAVMMLQGSWQVYNMKSDNEDWYTKNIGCFPFPKLDGSTADQSIVVGSPISTAFAFNTGSNKDLLNACFILATQYYNDDTYNKQYLAAGAIPAIEGIGDHLTDTCLKQMWNDFSSAGSVQMWYDQYLPPEVGEVHKSTCQELFGMTITPVQADKELQTAMTKYLAKKK